MSKAGRSSRQQREQADHRPDVAAFLGNVREVERLLQAAVRDALVMHKKLGYPIAAWQAGKVVWIRPDRIPVDG